MGNSRPWISAIAFGLGLSGAVFWFASAPLLAAYTGLFWAVGVGLTVHHADAIPGLLRGSSDWGMTTRLWSGAFGGLMALAATATMGPQVPVSTETSLVLGLLVIGVAITMANVGIGLTLSLAGEPSGMVDTRDGLSGSDT